MRFYFTLNDIAELFHECLPVKEVMVVLDTKGLWIDCQGLDLDHKPETPDPVMPAHELELWSRVYASVVGSRPDLSLRDAANTAGYHADVAVGKLREMLSEKRGSTGSGGPTSSSGGWPTTFPDGRKFPGH